MPRSPLRDGWRVLKRAPAVIVAEIAWRWTFGVALWAILYYSFREYLASVGISRAEYTLLRDLEPYTWVAVVARVMIALGNGFRLVGPILVPAIAILWIALATIGRAGTVRALVATEPNTNWPSSIALNAFRVVFAGAALLALFGGGIFVNLILGDTTQRFGEAVILMLFFMTVIGFLWGTVNWFFSVAPIFTASDHHGFWTSLGETARLYRRERTAFLSSGLWFTFARSLLIVAVTMASLVAFTAASPRRGIALMIAYTLIYFALSDALNMWRLATYISLMTPEPHPADIASPPSEPLTPISSEIAGPAESAAPDIVGAQASDSPRGGDNNDSDPATHSLSPIPDSNPQP